MVHVRSHLLSRFTKSRTALLQFLDVNILELDQAGRSDPAALLVLRAMVLEGEPPAVREVGDGRPRDDGLPVQLDLDRLPLDGDLEMVPLAHRLVGLGTRR